MGRTRIIYHCHDPRESRDSHKPCLEGSEKALSISFTEGIAVFSSSYNGYFYGLSFLFKRTFTIVF
ncbi:hypothetical protein BGZ60DRAFT_536412, partial [Tricladium varicosporioides]